MYEFRERERERERRHFDSETLTVSAISAESERNNGSVPKISVVVPVYNVEKYLAECLDSIVNQTLPDIEIICVNDGSTDSSPQILQQYAAKDRRITVINKPNGGLSSARNAAYPYLKGKYTLFVDSDDWIELDLCEKTFRKAEESAAPMTFFFLSAKGRNDKYEPWKGITPEDKITAAEKIKILACPSAWSKLWRTDFLLENHLTFAEGLTTEDLLHTWQALILASRIAVLPEQLYHYRQNENSIMGNPGKRIFDIFTICEKMYTFLKESRFYDDYIDAFRTNKWALLYHSFQRCAGEYKEQFAMRVRENVTDEDIACLRSGKVKSFLVCCWYRMEIEGGAAGHYCYSAYLAFRNFEKTVRHYLKPKKKAA